jgi:hypothetical protein
MGYNFPWYDLVGCLNSGNSGNSGMFESVSPKDTNFEIPTLSVCLRKGYNLEPKSPART